VPSGIPNTLADSPEIALNRPFALGRMPASLSAETAPLLAFLDRRHLPYDVTTDLALAQGTGPGVAGHTGVLFAGSEQLERLWLEGLAGAPPEAAALTAVTAGLDPVAEMFTERHAFARIRSRIIEANPELQERELIKLQRLAATIQSALEARGVPIHAAILAAQAGVTVFHVAFARWGLGVLAREQGDYDRARALGQEVLAMYQEAGDPFRVAISLSLLIAVAREPGEPVESIDLCEPALVLFWDSD